MSDRIIDLPSGRGVGFSSLGDALARRLVVFSLPTGLAGGFDPDPLVTDAWGVRVLVLDRPGYGSSAPFRDGEVPSVEARADNVAEYISWSEKLADEISKADFSTIGVIGWGTGAVFAASLAARHPDLVDRLALVGPDSPHHGRDERRSGLLEATRVHPSSTIDSLAAELSERDWNVSGALGIDDADPAFEQMAGLRSRLDRSLGEASIQGATGVAGDLVALGDGGWERELAGIAAETLIVAGDLDPVADNRAVRWWSKRISGARTVTVPGAGRLAVASEWKRILAHVEPNHGGLPSDVRE